MHSSRSFRIVRRCDRRTCPVTPPRAPSEADACSPHGHCRRCPTSPLSTGALSRIKSAGLDLDGGGVHGRGQRLTRRDGGHPTQLQMRYTPPLRHAPRRPHAAIHPPRASGSAGVEALVVDRARRSSVGGTGLAGWELRPQRGFPRVDTVRVSQPRRSEWGGAQESAAGVIEGAMDDQIRRSGPRRAAGQQPRTERYRD